MPLLHVSGLHLHIKYLFFYLFLKSDKLEERITELGMKPEDYDFYLDLRKYGSTRHAGFGLGFERMVMYATGIANIRDVIPYPRTVGKCQY